MEDLDFYQRLSVPPDVTKGEVKRAFYKLAARYHPDKVAALAPGAREAAEDIMRYLNQAYTVLMDEEKRALYDRCVASGSDFEAALAATLEETEAEEMARVQNEEQLVEAYKATVKDINAAIQALVPGARWSPGESADYFDLAIEGQAAGKRLKVHVKIVSALSTDDVAAVANYATELVKATPRSLTREFHSYLLITTTMPYEVDVAAAVLGFNSHHWQGAQGRAPKAMIGYGGPTHRIPALPGVERPEPDLRLLPLGG